MLLLFFVVVVIVIIAVVLVENECNKMDSELLCLVCVYFNRHLSELED